MKRTICIIILFSMVLHSASRLGLVSYLYDNRHDIAYAFGLIGEVPIAMCNGDYFAETGPLIIEDDHDSAATRPGQFTQAHEIILFVESDHFLETRLHIDDSLHNTAAPESFYDAPAIAIFHPPCHA